MEAARLTPKGLAFCDFAFRDGLALGLTPKDAYEIASRLIENWNGSESLLEIYNRTERRPSEVSE